jgi:hypothetical protein
VEKPFSVIPQTTRSGVTPAVVGGPFGGATTDWAVFRTLRNSTTRRTAFEEQGAYYKTDPTGAQFNPTTITGYGADGGDPNAAVRANRHCQNCSATNAFGESTRNYIQQTHTGPTYTLYLNNNVFHGTHTCGGNSGSLLLQPRLVDGQVQMRAVGVHTGGERCAVLAGSDAPANRGTNIAHAPFRSHIDEVCNMCDANNDKRVDTTDLAEIRNALGLAAAGRQRLNPDNDAQVTVNDLRLCSLMCTNANCQ